MFLVLFYMHLDKDICMVSKILLISIGINLKYEKGYSSIMLASRGGHANVVE